MLNSILIIPFQPSLGKAVILDLPLEQPVHPLPLEPGAVHLRSDQDTDAVQDAVLELTLPRRNQLITNSHSHLEGVLVLIDELALTDYLTIGLLVTRMPTSE